VFCGALLAELSVAIVGSGLKALDTHGPDLEAGFGSPSQIGELFLTKFLVAFELVSLLLLIAAVGAIVLASREEPPATPSHPQPDRGLGRDRQVL